MGEEEGWLLGKDDGCEVGLPVGNADFLNLEENVELTLVSRMDTVIFCS